jgi:hypothetical protein
MLAMNFPLQADARAASDCPLRKREASVKWEQEREYEAMLSKTAHLRELRLAKLAADKEAEALTPVSRPTARHRIKKQTNTESFLDNSRYRYNWRVPA